MDLVFLGHAGEGHWYDYVLYLAPLIAVAIALGREFILARKGAEENPDPDVDSSR